MTADAIARLGLGTVQFGLPYGVSNTQGQVQTHDAATIAARAHAAGMRILDTAAAYGTAETVVAALKPRENGWRVVTKTLRVAEGLETVVARARASAEALGPGCDLLVHSAGDLAGRHGDALWRALHDLKGDGLFARIGFSAYAEDEPLALAQRFAPDLVQVPLSILDQRLLQDGTLSALKTRGIEVHVRSLFLQGLLLIDPAELPSSLTSAAAHLAHVRAQATKMDASPLSLAVGFALSRPEIDAAIVGVTSVQELDGILDAALTPCPSIDWTALALDDDFILTPSRWAQEQ